MDSLDKVMDTVDDKVFRAAIQSKIGRLFVRIGQTWTGGLENLILVLICAVAFFVRLFAVLRHESVIHEFDPHFNYRVTEYLSEKGFDEFWNWFDDRSWYPLGRVVGQTLFPGLMTTAALLHGCARYVGLIIHIRHICVFIAPIFSGVAAIAAYLLTKEVTDQPGAGLFAAAFLSLSPAYLSRSVAGSYDNEAVAIPALVFAFYMFVKALNRRTVSMAMLAALAYFYMVASWGGYIFITNAVAVYGMALAVLGRMKEHHYVTFCVFHVFGTMLCLNIPFVNFNAALSSEHMASHGVFILLNVYFFSKYVKGLVKRSSFKSFTRLFFVCAVASLLLVFLWLSATGRTAWAGRSMTLLDPSYAAKHIPIIASVSEHQPTLWSSYIFDLQLCLLLSPVGIYICFTRRGDGYLFVGVYAILAVYFSGVMVRLMLILAPASCVMAAIGLSSILSTLCVELRGSSPSEQLLQKCKAEADKISLDGHATTSAELDTGAAAAEAAPANRTSSTLLLAAVGALFFFTSSYIAHGVFASSMAYSHPSVVLSKFLRDGTRLIQDDFREAFYWFRKNTHPDARLMSWWDYGYQTSVLGNRTVLVDNNTWNNTHIATVGLALASPEEEALPILLKHDVDFVFVVFGGMAQYTGDDINKFLWMVRIAGGVYPHIKESNYLTANRQYAVGNDATPTLANSLMYKMSYYRFAESAPEAMDRARQVQMPLKPIELKYIEEAYTTKNWMVRIYRVKKPPNRKPVKSRWTK